MMKWFRRLVLYPITLLFILIIAFLLFNNTLYYSLKGSIGIELQWYGYEEKGNDIIENSLKNMDNVTADSYRIYSIVNTKIGNYDEAIRYLNKAVNQDSNMVDGYYGWVLLYYYRDYDKALFHLNRLDSTTDFVDYVSDDNILYAKGLCYKQKGNYVKALELFKQAIDHEIKEHNEEWITHQMFFQTGRTLHNMNRYSEAIEYYNKAINNWNGSSESIFYKGLAEIELGIDTGCENLNLALEKVKNGKKSTDTYVRLFDEIYVDQVEEIIKKNCEN